MLPPSLEPNARILIVNNDRAVRDACVVLLRCASLAAFALASCTGQLDASQPAQPIFDAGALGSERDHDAASVPSVRADAASTAASDAGAISGDAEVASDAAAASDADTASPPKGSAGCGRSAAPPDGLQTITVNGKSRTFIMHAPADYDTRKPYPLLFGFHGASRSAADFDNDKGGYHFGPALGDRTVVVYPNALTDKSGTTTWSRDTQDDVAFFDAMLAQMQSGLCIDGERVFAVGHSSGAYFSNTLGCLRGDVLRAIGVVAGGVRDFSSCKGEVAAWMAHGTDDNQVPISQGELARKHWVEANGCSPEPATSPVSPSPCVAHANCRAGYPVHWCEHHEDTYSSGSPPTPTHHGWPSFATAGITSFIEAL